MSQTDSNKVHKPNGSGLTRLLKAYKCSMKGFRAAYIHEAAFRQEILLALILLPCSFVLSTSLASWLGLVLPLIGLLIIEIINSAIEALADQISLEHHELIGRAKDLGSAAVFLAMVIVVLVWGTSLYTFINK